MKHWTQTPKGKAKLKAIAEAKKIAKEVPLPSMPSGMANAAMQPQTQSEVDNIYRANLRERKPRELSINVNNFRLAVYFND